MRRSRGYTNQRGRRGGSTATIERGEAEALQINGAAGAGSTATIEGEMLIEIVEREYACAGENPRPGPRGRAALC